MFSVFPSVYENYKHSFIVLFIQSIMSGLYKMEGRG